ncbi:MAG TPA: carbohydrate ABC transporter permease [Clostridiales bacterium]|nr:carbohydrate ABC transporter permease [Clostridiales bacterium]
MMVTGSFMGAQEINEMIGPVFGNEDKMAGWHLIPRFPTLKPYVELLLDSPNFFVMFWNSCRQVFPGLIGQLFIAVPAAWSFARYSFKGKKPLFILYIVLMIMPFQVTMVSSYLVLDKFRLLNTDFALILPNIFSAFPVFIMEKFFKAIPGSLIEAAKIDGAGELKIFMHIGIPMGASGIVSAMVLGFLEAWNGIEQPLTFLKDRALWPLSLYLPEISKEKLGAAMVASVIAMMPAILIFLYGQKYIEQGIAASGIKE